MVRCIDAQKCTVPPCFWGVSPAPTHMPFSHFCQKWENTPKCSWDFSELVLGSFPEKLPVMSILRMWKKYLHMSFYSDIGCLTGSEVTVSPIDFYNTHIGERIMMKEIKNPCAMTIEFRPEVANALRDLCSKTGITLTRAVNNAVEAYMPIIQ